MDAFFCIVLSFFTLKWAWKSDLFSIRRAKRDISTPVVKKSRKETERQKEHTDEIITTILPTINNGE